MRNKKTKKKISNLVFVRFGTVNYEDPNFNVELPIFVIHGNHDDPTGSGGLSALDLLSVSNFVNYFGKSDNIDDIHVRPILISKGETKVKEKLFFTIFFS